MDRILWMRLRENRRHPRKQARALDWRNGARRVKNGRSRRSPEAITIEFRTRAAEILRIESPQRHPARSCEWCRTFYSASRTLELGWGMYFNGRVFGCVGSEVDVLKYLTLFAPRSFAVRTPIEMHSILVNVSFDRRSCSLNRLDAEQHTFSPVRRKSALSPARLAQHGLSMNRAHG